MSNKHFWFEACTKEDAQQSNWYYCVGVDDNTPVALIAGPDDYTACARARIICKALNDAALAMTLKEIAGNATTDDYQPQR